MTEEPNNNNNAPSDEKKSSKTSYLQLSSLGLNYIERQQKYLWISLLWPLITIILQIFNTIFLFNLQNNPSGFQPNQPYQPNQPNQFHQIHIGPIDQITPSIILIILCIIALIKFISLLSLRKKVIVYRLQQSTDNSTSETFNDDENEVSPKHPDTTMASLFYNLADHMDLIQKISILFYIGCAIFIEWYLRFFPFLFLAFPRPNIDFNTIMFYVNFIDVLGLAIYLIPDIRQFVHWHRKLKKLHDYEHQVYKEFEH